MSAVVFGCSAFVHAVKQYAWSTVKMVSLSAQAYPRDACIGARKSREMCGRFGLTRSPDLLVGRLVGDPGRLPDEVAQPRFNIAPTQRVRAVVNEAPPAAMRLRWGLLPALVAYARCGRALDVQRADRNDRDVAPLR